MVSWSAVTGSWRVMCTSSSVHCALLDAASAPTALTSDGPEPEGGADADAGGLSLGPADLVAVCAPWPLALVCVAEAAGPACEWSFAPDGTPLAAGRPL